MRLNLRGSLHRANSNSFPQSASTSLYEWRSKILKGCQAAVIEAAAATASRCRENQDCMAGRRCEQQGTGHPDFAEAVLQPTYTVPSTFLSEFLEFGVCREQFFSEISLRDQLATEARLVAHLTQAAANAAAAATTQSAQPQQPASNTLPAMVSVTLETAELSETALESLEDRTGPAQTAYAPQEHSSAASTRSVTAGGLHSSGIEEPKLSGPDHRRRLRRAKWQQCAVAGAAVGVEAGALELALKRRLQAERRRSPKRASTSCRADAANRQSSPSLGQVSHDPQERQQSWRATSSDPINSALDILFGGEQHQVLDRDEETRLIRDMQGGLAIQAVIQDLQDELHRQPNAVELTGKLGMSLDQISAALAVGLRAKHELVHANKRLVFKMAHSYGWDTRIPFEDYVMAGMEGLVTGLLKFDPARGHKLSSLLVWWIRNSISVLSTAVNNVVHVPRAAQFAARKLRQSRRQLASRLGRQPEDEELGREMGLTPLQFSRVLHAEKFTILQLEDTVPSTGSSGSAVRSGTPGDSLEYGSLLEADEPVDQEQASLQRSLHEAMEQVLDTLPLREASVVRSLYGIGSRDSQEAGPATNGPLKQSKVAEEWGVTPKRISQIRLECLQRLRKQQMHTLQQTAVDCKCLAA